MNLTEDITTAVQFAEAEWGIDVEPISAGTVGEMAWVCVDTGEATPIVILDAKPYAVATPIGLDLTTEWRSDEPTSLTAGGGPSQARAPKGTPIGGEWIETPGGLLTAVSTGGGAGQESAPTGVQKIVREQGGASLDPVTLEQPTDGFMVAVQGHNREVPEDEFFGPGGEDALHSWIADNQAPLSEPGAHIGLWHDTEHGEVVLDVSQNVKDRDEAIRLGQERNQQSIWDVVNGEEIPTGGTGDRQASAYRMEHHDRSHTDGADPSPALRHTLERGGSEWVLRLGRGAPAGVRPLGDQRAPAPRLSALVSQTFRSGDAKQARAPKGSPGGIGGQWIDTVRGILSGLSRALNPSSGGEPGPLVEHTEKMYRPDLSPNDIAKLRESSISGPHIDPVSGEWTPERRALHEKIVNDFLSGVEPAPDGEGVVYFNGGGPGSGKSSFTSGKIDTGYPPTRGVNDVTGEMDFAGMPKPGAVLIDPDSIKMQLPEVQAYRESQRAHGALADPEAVGGNWASQSHEESSYIAKMVYGEALARNLPIVYDGTGTKIADKAKQALDAGYGATKANYMYVEPQAALVSAIDRAGRIGRNVPPDLQAAQYEVMPQAFETTASSGLFTEVNLWDRNNTATAGGEVPKIFEISPSGDRIILDQAAYERFLTSGDRLPDLSQL